MENGSELLRLLAQLQDRPSSTNEGVAIWVLAMATRKLAVQLALATGALAGVITENDLAVTPEVREIVRKVNEVTEGLREPLSRVAEIFKPPESQD